jgi:FMN-dependent NADH-azoreductase
MLSLDVDFIIPELTLARVNPAMSALVDAADASRAKAHQDATEKAKALGARFAA